jgi:hypothetical protein
MRFQSESSTNILRKLETLTLRLHSDKADRRAAYDSIGELDALLEHLAALDVAMAAQRVETAAIAVTATVRDLLALRAELESTALYECDAVRDMAVQIFSECLAQPHSKAARPTSALLSPAERYPWLRERLEQHATRIERILSPHVHNKPKGLRPMPYSRRSRVLKAYRKGWLGWTQARELISAQVVRLGFASTAAYADASPDLFLEELVARLGLDGVHVSQFSLKLWEEATATGTTERCARDLLARDLRRLLPKGWSRRIDSPQASVFYLWEKALPLNYQPIAKAIYHALKNSDIPDGWRPDGSHDPILVEVCGNYWPVEPHPASGYLVLTGAGDITVVYREPPVIDEQRRDE